MTTIYAIMGRYWDADQEHFARWLLPKAFYEREQAEAHIREIHEEIEQIWQLSDDDGPRYVEWAEGKWRPEQQEGEPQAVDYSWHETKLASLDPTLVNQYLCESDTSYQIHELELTNPT